MSLRVGVTLPQFRSDADGLVEGARRAEAAGFDSVWVFDHLWPLGRPERPILECWSALAYLAAATEAVTVGSLVTRSTLRPPRLLAHMAATVARVARGRLIAGVGSGDPASRAENAAFNLPYLSGDDRYAQLEDTVRVLAGHRDRNGPEGSFEIWVGGASSRIALLAARHAQAYNCWGVPAEVVARRARLLAGVTGDAPELTWGGQVVVGRSDADARDRLGGRDPALFLTGGPARVAERLTEIAGAGASHLVLASPFAAEPETYELLAEVAGEVRSG